MTTDLFTLHFMNIDNIPGACVQYSGAKKADVIKHTQWVEKNVGYKHPQAGQCPPIAAPTCESFAGMPPCPPAPGPMCNWNYEKTVRSCNISNYGSDQGDIELNQNVATDMWGDVSTVHMVKKGGYCI